MSVPGMIGIPEHDARVLRLADKRMRAMGRRIFSCAWHRGCHRRSCVRPTILPGVLTCTECGEEFGLGEVCWIAEGAYVVAATTYELDDGNPAEAGRVLWEAVIAGLQHEANLDALPGEDT